MNIFYHHRTRFQGVERVHIMGVVNALRQLGHSVIIVSPPKMSDDTATSKARTTHTRAKNLWSFVSRYTPELMFEFLEICYNVYAYFQMKFVTRDYRIDFMYERYALFGFAGVLFARRHKIPILLEINDAASVERNRSLRLPKLASKLEKWIFQRATKLITVSKAFRRIIILTEGIPENKIEVIPNAIDPEVFDKHQCNCPGIRGEYRLNSKIIIGYIGGFAYWHRLDFLVDVIAGLVPQHLNIHCLLVGEGVSRKYLEAYIERERLTQYFTFTGHVSYEQIPSYISVMDIAILPHANEYCSPVKLFEYMAMGKAIIAPRLANIEEILTEGTNGMFFEPENRTQLGNALIRLIEDREQRKQLGRNARQTVYKKHLWIHNAQRIVDIALTFSSDF